jgi:hypothetical protein
VVLVDPEGEDWGFKAEYEILSVGKSRHCDLDVKPEQSLVLVDRLLDDGLPIHLDFSGTEPGETIDFCMHFFQALWDKEDEVRRPVVVFLEEAHLFVPQQGIADAGVKGSNHFLHLFKNIVLRGRKRGIGVVLVAQRSSAVNKDVLTQAANAILHKVNHPTDRAVYEDIADLPPKEVRGYLTRMSPGDALVCRKGVWQFVHVAEQRTFHAGFSPKLGAGTVNPGLPRLRTVSEKLIGELKAAAEAVEVDPTAVYQNRWLTAEAKLVRAEETIKRLEAALQEAQDKIETLGLLKVDSEALATGLTNGLAEGLRALASQAPPVLLSGTQGAQAPSGESSGFVEKPGGITRRQRNYLLSLYRLAGEKTPADLEEWSMAQASVEIARLKKIERAVTKATLLARTQVALGMADPVPAPLSA